MENFTQIIGDIGTFILEWYWVPFLLIYISTIATILLESKNPTKTISWILIIVFLPLIGLILYFFFGQEFNKKKMFSRVDENHRKNIEANWTRIQENFEAVDERVKEQIGDLSRVFYYLRQTKSSPTYFDDEIQIYTNGEEKFPAFLEALKSARKFIHLEYYIFEDDLIGSEVISILKEKAEEGVEVRVMADNLGSPKLVRNARKIFQNSKVQFQTFLPVYFRTLAHSNYRNHRKILLVDGEIGFVGGINISDKYINVAPYNQSNKVYWRDTSISVKGESLELLHIRFWLNWLATEGESYDFQDPKYRPNKISVPKTNSLIGYGFTLPAGEVPSAMESIMLAITLAKKRVEICTPYFIPSEEFKSALMIAVSSGVEVELMMPKKGDSLFVQQASLSFLKPLMKRGVKVYLYEKGFLHAKTVVVDEELAFVGTVNLDNRSFFINFEVTAAFHEKISIEKLTRQFHLDKKDSEQMTFEKWNQESTFKRLFASICRLLAPIL